MSNRISIAVIGAGKNSRNTHLPILKELHDRKTYRLTIVCDLNAALAESVREEFGFAECTSDADIIFERDDVDAVYVIGTSQMHFGYAKKALLSGKHVFVEKPPAPSAQDALELMHLAKRQGRVAVVGLNRRFEASINAAKERLHETGRIHSMVGLWSKAAVDRPLTLGQTSRIQSDSIHTIDALVYLMGEPPTELHCATNSAIGHVPQNAAGMLAWRDGGHAAFSLNNSTGRRTERYEIHGSGVSYCCENGTLTVTSRTESDAVDFGTSARSRGFVEEHEEFAAAIIGERSPRHSMEQGFISLRLVELIEEGYCGPIDWPAELWSTRSEPLPQGSPGIERAGSASVRAPRGKASIVVYNPGMMHGALPALAKRFTILGPEQLETSRDGQRGSVVAAITGKGGRAMEDAVLDSLPALSVVGVLGASVRRYNAEGMLARGIQIINTAEAYAEIVAEFTIMLAILGVRRASLSHEEMRQGGWGGQLPGIRQRALRYSVTWGSDYLLRQRRL